MDDVDKKKVWNEVLESIKVSVSSATFTTWFAQTYLATLVKDKEKYIAEIGCASSFVKTTIETRYFGLIQDYLTESLGSKWDLLIIVKENAGKRIVDEAVLPLFGNVNKNEQ